MGLLVWYLCVAVIGYFVGSIIRKRKNKNYKIKWVGPFQTVLIIIMILSMGIRLGINEDVVKGLGSIGISGLITAMAAMAGSVIAVFFARKLMKINKRGEKAND